MIPTHIHVLAVALYEIAQQNFGVKLTDSFGEAPDDVRNRYIKLAYGIEKRLTDERYEIVPAP